MAAGGMIRALLTDLLLAAVEVAFVATVAYALVMAVGGLVRVAGGWLLDRLSNGAFHAAELLDRRPCMETDCDGSCPVCLAHAADFGDPLEARAYLATGDDDVAWRDHMGCAGPATPPVRTTYSPLTTGDRALLERLR